MIRRVALALMLVGCGEAAAPAASVPVPAALPDDGLRATVIGWDHVPAPPSAAALLAHADAMRVHGEAHAASADEATRIYEGSALAFQRVAEVYPDYLDARFSQACALARLGRHEVAIAILVDLLAIDLPSFSPRLDAAPDLASLADARGAAAFLAYRQRLAERYARALEEGVPVVHVPRVVVLPAASDDADEVHRTTHQAGVWLARERRFVPMGPLIVRTMDALTADLALTATVVDREHHAVLEFVGTGTWSDGEGPIDEGAIVVWEAGTGGERERITSRRPDAIWTTPIEAHATDTGVAAHFAGAGARLSHGAFDPSVRPSIAVTRTRASVVLPHDPPGGVVPESLPAGLYLLAPEAD